MHISYKSSQTPRYLVNGTDFTHMRKTTRTILAQSRISPKAAKTIKQIGRINGRTYAGQIRYLLETFASDNTVACK